MASNKALTFFLVLTIVISVFGTFFLIDGILRFPSVSYTTFATTTPGAIFTSYVALIFVLLLLAALVFLIYLLIVNKSKNFGKK